MRFTHEAHVMPSTGNDTISIGWLRGGAGVVMVSILRGSILAVAR